MKSSITVHRTGVLNQFKFDGGRGKAACIPICVQALYHLHEALEDGGKLLNPGQWKTVMERGTRVWELWRERNPLVESSFPSIEEIIQLKECEGFYRLFSKQADSFLGLVLHSDQIDNGQGPLNRVVCSLTNNTRTKLFTRTTPSSSCAIVILPNHHSIALIAYRDSVLFFDPHGTRGTDETELVQFAHAGDVVPYFQKRYGYDPVDVIMSSELAHYYTDELLQIQFGYSATVFTTK